MKLHSLLPLAFGAFLAFAPAVHAAPKLGIEEAVKVAQQYLKEQGMADKYYISALTLESTDMRRASFRWYARWSESVQLSEDRRELGVQIDMDGTLARVVEGREGRAGLQNHRTRSDRPSILDLKH